MMDSRTGPASEKAPRGLGWCIEVAGIFGFIALGLLNLVRIAATRELLSWWTPLAALLGLLLADFVSGVVHWMADTWGSESTPWVGPRFVRPFRIHHTDPLAMLRGDVFETNGNTALLALPLLLLALALPLGHGLGRFLIVFLVTLCICGFATNQIHKWAHMSDSPRAVRWLQRRGLILTPEHHEVHHTAPFATHYCITTGWCNGLLASISFFSALERWISGLTGLTPRAYDLAQAGGAAESPSGQAARPRTASSPAPVASPPPFIPPGTSARLFSLTRPVVPALGEDTASLPLEV